MSAEQPQCHSYSIPMEPSGEGFALEVCGQYSRLNTSFRSTGEDIRAIIRYAARENRKKRRTPPMGTTLFVIMLTYGNAS